MSGTYFDVRRSPERACRKLEDWPELDRRLWLAALEPGDLLDGGGSRSTYRSISNRKTERGYGRWLTFLALRSELSGAPADRITPDSVTQYVAELQALGNGSYTVLCRLQELHDAAGVMDARDWSWIRGIAKRVRARHIPVREKAL